MKRKKFPGLYLALGVIVGTAPASLSSAQTANPEVEPNDGKAAATAAASGTTGLVANEFLTGTTTGSSTTTAGPGSADYFRVKTAAAPPGIYRHRLVITSTTAGHTGTIRALSQTGSAAAGGTIGTADNTAQTSSTTSTPPRFNQWYGFGKQEEIYYRVAGVAATTAPYTATYEVTPVTPTVFTGVVTAGPVTIERGTGNTSDTDFWIYDSNLNPVPLAGRDDGTPNATLTVTLTPGEYTLAASLFNFANNQASPPGESFFSNVLDFPNAITSSSTLTSSNFNFRFTSQTGAVETSGLTIGGPYEVAFIRFTVSPPPSISGSGSVTPTTVSNLGTGVAQFVVNVLPASNPTSTGVAVTLDLSSLGGGSAVPALDDGLSGDGAAGDNVFGLAYTVPTDFAPGTYSVPFTISDAQARSFSLSIGGIRVVGRPVATDLGTLTTGSTPFTAAFAPGEIKWVRFTLDAPVTSKNRRFLDIETAGSILTGGSFANDTFIGLYDNSGNRIATDDDDSNGFTSQLTFGGAFPARPAPGDGLVADGRDGERLPAGTYYLAITAFPSTFNPTLWDVTTTNTLTGSINAAFTLGQLAVPTPTILVGPVTNPANGSRYYLFDRPLDFWGAQAAAAALGGNLATIDDAAENEWVRVNILGFDQTDRRAWIGFNDFDTEGAFAWTSGATPSYTNWNGTEPNNGGTGTPENYAELLGSNGLWNDINVRGATGGNWTVVEVVVPACPADFNQSGTVTVQDVFDFLAAFFSNGPGSDFNQSGGVTVQDIFDYLTAYFTPCP